MNFLRERKGLILSVLFFLTMLIAVVSGKEAGAQANEGSSFEAASLPVMCFGFGDRLMLCNDMGKKSHHPQYGGGPGWNWIHDKFLPRLIDEGFDPAQVHKFNYENPQAFYTLREKHPR